MPRPRNKSTKPSAAGRFAVSPGGATNGQQLELADICDSDELHRFLSEVVQTGASVTIGLTRDLKTLSMSFFVDGERYPWYIQSQDDWDAMVIATSVEQD